MASGSRSTLDSLMLSCADLNAPKKGSSFRGPALKDVKVTKTTGPSFQPSQKARDWSSLSQNLEDAFALTSPPTQPTVLPQQEYIIPVTTESVDDWGDFQEPVPVFAGADSLTGQQVTAIASQAFFSHPEPTASFVSNVQPSKPTVDDDDDDFADFVAARPATFCSLSSTIPPIAPITTEQRSVGSRLATFEKESPVHHFKPVEPQLPSSSKIPGSAEDDEEFGDFSSATITHSAASSAAASLPPIISPSVSTSQQKAPTPWSPTAFLSTTHPSSSEPGPLPMPEASSSGPDKYSALRDLFSCDPEPEVSEMPSLISHVSSIDEKPSETSSLPPTLPILSPATPVEAMYSLPTIPPSQASTCAGADDFGDFMTVPKPPETSVLNVEAASDVPETVSVIGASLKSPDPFFMPQQSQPARSAYIPWHDEGPPPMDDDSFKEDNLEGDFTGFSADEVLAGDTFGSSLHNHDILNDEEFFEDDQKPTVQILKTEQDVTLNSDPPSDNLSSNMGSLSITKTSPDSLSLKSLEPELKQENDKYADFYDLSGKPKSSQDYEWVKCLKEIQKVLKEAETNFGQISGKEDLLEEVLQSEKGKNYVQDIVRVYKVHCRIGESHARRPNLNETVLEIQEEIEKMWRRFRASITDHEVENPTDSCNGFENTDCAICLCPVGAEEMLAYSSRYYHPTCANFWVNCVDTFLPN